MLASFEARSSSRPFWLWPIWAIALVSFLGVAAVFRSWPLAIGVLAVNVVAFLRIGIQQALKAGNRRLAGGLLVILIGWVCCMFVAVIVGVVFLIRS
jgi:hypothetical protein